MTGEWIMLILIGSETWLVLISGENYVPQWHQGPLAFIAQAFE